MRASTVADCACSWPLPFLRRGTTRCARSSLAFAFSFSPIGAPGRTNLPCMILTYLFPRAYPPIACGRAKWRPLMTTIRIEKGILKGLELEDYTSERLESMAEPAHATEITRISFYKKNLGRSVYRGMFFSECSFAKSEFRHVSFYKCTFHKVDFTRTKFLRCFFFKCKFDECDPYYAHFEDTEVDPTSFARCYRRDSDWNKALVLFSELRRSLDAYGEGRLSRAADFYFRTWQRRRLQHLWKDKQQSGFLPWFWNVCVWLLTGYGERPAYLSLWAVGIISIFAFLYKASFPYSVTSPKYGYADFWYFSFRIFVGRGFSSDLQTLSLFLVQLGEFGCGLLLVALLIASVTRKLSP
jgi:hypothetical protein